MTQFKQLIIDSDVRETPLAAELLQWATHKAIPTHAVSAEQIGLEQRQSLHLKKQKGAVVRVCQGKVERHGVDDNVCCNLRVINQVEGCPLTCNYCILQSYSSHQPTQVAYANVDEMLDQAEAQFRQEPNRLFRVTTGELGDSLATDNLLQFSPRAVQRFATIPNALLELKTKSTLIDHLLDLPHCGHTVLSWSLNTDWIIQHEETGTPTLERRLRAAERAERAGYWLGFHFDPAIIHPNWEDGYRDAIQSLFSVIDPLRIAWISVGALRGPPTLKQQILKQHPESHLMLGELLPGHDGKLRYIKPLRIRLLRHIVSTLQSFAEEKVFIYLCMESKDVWRKVMSFVPENSDHLEQRMMDQLRPRLGKGAPIR